MKKKMLFVTLALLAVLALVSCGLIPLPATPEQNTLVRRYELLCWELFDVEPELFRVDELEGKTVRTLKNSYENAAKGVLIESIEYTENTDGSSKTLVVTGTLGELGRHELVIGKIYESGELKSNIAAIDGKFYILEIVEPK